MLLYPEGFYLRVNVLLHLTIMETLLIMVLAFGIIYIMLKSMHTYFESFHFKMETVVKCLSESFLDFFPFKNGNHTF